MFKTCLKKYVFVFSLCYNLLFIKFIVCDFPIAGVAAINEQQRQEIQRLKSELSESLYNDNTNEAARDVIVQPAWTLSDNKSVQIGVAEVKLNAQNRNEAASLRAEIEQAVAKDSYATAGAAKMSDIKALEAALSTKEKGQEALLTMTGQQTLHITPKEEQLGAGSSINGDEIGNAKAPNIITANIGDDLEIDMRKLQRLVVSKRRTREVLVLKYLEEDFTFEFGDDVNEWKHIVHAGQEYFIGRRITDLLIVHKESGKLERTMVLNVGHVIVYMETYTHWNSEQQQQEGIIVIATGDKVLWYRANHETKHIELYWDWMVGSSIAALTYFALDTKDYLIISSNKSSLIGQYALNIYEFKLEIKEFWVAQHLQLHFPCEIVTVLNSGRDVILAVPQNNTAILYTFNPHVTGLSHIRFEFRRSVAAEGILTIAGFKMGGHSYLALTGFQPQILLYQQGDFISKTILGNNFGLVELFFPIPVRTYRDDLILLVQHKVDFSTHTLTVVETLIWDGEAFETSIPVPCHLGKYVVYGVGCMLDVQRDEGLKGAVFLKNFDGISIVVPRYKAPSGLFRLHTELLAKNSELLDLQEIFDFLKEWVKEQDDLIAQSETFLQIPNEELIKYQPDLTFIETLKTPQFEFNGEVGDIYVNDYKWTVEDSNIDLESLIQNIEDLERSLNSGRQRRNLDDILHDTLSFDEVKVEDLELGRLNGDQFYIQNGDLNFEGLVELSELEVLEKFMDLRKREVNNENLILEGDLEFDRINGLDWSDIKDNFVLRNQKLILGELEVKGEVFVENLLTINTLNTLIFPNDFMLTNGPVTSIVNAEKHFINKLSASSVDTNGLVNGKNPVNAITLTDAQEWQGMPTFKHLEVTQLLELHGWDNDTFTKRHTLKETSIINSTCHFDELIVNGPIVLKGEMDNQYLGLRLNDIVLKSQDPTNQILIPSLKSFNFITFPTDFHLEDKTINGISANDFVTIHTEQNLNITSLEGFVYFYNLTLNGSYDGVKIDDVLEEVILLDQPIDLSTTELIFLQKLKANSVSILDTINKQPIKDNLQTLQADLDINTAEFNILQTQQADFSHDILGQGKLNNVELHSFVKERSWHEPPIRGNIFLNELILEQGIQADELHGIKADFLFDFLNQIDELPDMVLNGQIQVDHITVTGDIQLHKLNGLLFDEEIQLSTVKLKHPNFLSTNLNFKKHLHISGQLNVVGDFRGKYMPDLIDDIIIRTINSCVVIKAPKSFLRPVEVLQNTQITALNGLPMENMAWKSKRNNFKGSLHLKGNLVAHELYLQGNLNNFNWQNIESLLYFDEQLQNFVLKNTIEFRNPVYLEDLTVISSLNGVSNLSDFFANLIYKNKLCVLKGKNTFTGRVSIEEGANIKNLNGLDLTYFFNNLVFVQGSQPIVVQAPVTFKNLLRANEINVEKSLMVEYINSCSIREWLSNSLRVDRDQNISHNLQFSAGSLDGNCLSVHNVNDKDLSRIFTLNTPQMIDDSVKFSTIVLNGFIVSKGKINNLNLEAEFNNTLMTYGHQHIFTPLTIKSVAVLGDLNVRGLVNGNINLKDVATLQEDLVFESPLYFQSIYSPQVIIKDLVTGIEFNKWFESAVKYEYQNIQYISGNWSTKNLTVRTGPEDFQYLINGYDPWHYYSYIRSARSDNKEDEEICLLIKQIWQGLAKKPVFIKYIEQDFNMDLGTQLKNISGSLNNVFYLKSNEKHFLLVNLACKSFIYKWLAEENTFVFKSSFESGLIDEIEVIPAYANATKLEFITNVSPTEKLNCSLKNVNKWRLENDSIILDDGLPEALELLYRTQGNSSSFWTLYNETLQELDLDYKIKHEWQLPLEKNKKTHYRFVPLSEEQGILLTNGERLALLSNNLENETKKLLKAQESEFFQTSYFENLKDSNSESLLKPNSFASTNFNLIIERILTDLDHRLNAQVNITQLSIPESDLFDENLLPDFLAIMGELQNQNIYPPETFNISFANIMLPENPAQVLAARVVQISWPVAVKIHQIHSYLRSNESHDHSLCTHITKSLGFFINDILMLANEYNSSKHAEDNTLKLSTLIERIRTFGMHLDEFVKIVKNHKDTETQKHLFEQSRTSREVKLFSQNQNDLQFVENTYLPGYNQGEIMSLLVGSSSNPQRLWAVINKKSSLAANNNPGIFLYLAGLKVQLYQVISALQPRSLQQLRIKQETLLLYIQECCLVKILKYRGSRGFSKFAEIRSKAHIRHILTISLPSKQENPKHILILLLESSIKFYEFFIEGYDDFEAFSDSPHNPLNCL